VSALIVDDEADLRHLARLVLEGQEDIAVVGEASTGRQALALLEETAPDVVVIDLTMPGWDGITTARAVRGRRPGQPIILWSAHLTSQVRRVAAAHGISGCVEKGDLRHLAAEIRRLGGRELAEATD
jgi:DNA-binding NarL/FixJ family response regulator